MLRLTDFRMAGFLVARGIPLASTETNRKDEVVFIFEHEDAQKTLHLYPTSLEASYDAACKNMQNFIKMRKQNSRKGEN